MTQLLILAAVFLGTVGVLIGGYLFVNRRGCRAADAALSAVCASAKDLHRRARGASSATLNVSDLPALDRLLAGRGITSVVAEQLQRGGADGTPGAFLLRASSYVAIWVRDRLVFRGAPSSASLARWSDS